MIQLVYPKGAENCYLFVDNSFVGPMDLSGLPSTESVTFRSRLDSISERPGIYGENSIDHEQLSGEILYLPELANAILEPTTSDPNKTKVPMLNSASRLVWETAIHGFAHSGAPGVVVGHYVATNVWYQKACYYDASDQSWHLYKMQTKPNDPYSVEDFYEIKISGMKTVKNYPDRREVKQEITQHYTYTKFTTTSYDWSRSVPLGAFRNYRPDASVETRVWAATTPKFEIRRCPLGTVMSPTAARAILDANVQRLAGYPNLLAEKHFGDLAMDASKKVLTNTVNMLEFLRDLRHPTQLIPKLKNLRKLRGLKKLKNVAGNYLTVEYGILPTVSDLQDIWQAMRKVAPYLDKNGYQILTAGHSDSLDHGLYRRSIEQHIKLAVDDDTMDGLNLLVQKMENTGFLPTLENVWDLIPYSFIIDWFTGIGDWLDRNDSRRRIDRLGIRYVTLSRKDTLSIDSESIDSRFRGELSWVTYHRWVTDHCPLPPLSLDPPDDFNHWLESGALLITRLK